MGGEYAVKYAVSLRVGMSYDEVSDREALTRRRRPAARAPRRAGSGYVRPGRRGALKRLTCYNVSSNNPKVACSRLLHAYGETGCDGTARSPGDYSTFMNPVTPDRSALPSDTLTDCAAIPHAQIDTRSDAWVPDSRVPGPEPIRRHIRRRKLAELALSCRCGCLPPTTRFADLRRAE